MYAYIRIDKPIRSFRVFFISAHNKQKHSQYFFNFCHYRKPLNIIFYKINIGTSCLEQSSTECQLRAMECLKNHLENTYQFLNFF